jgi:hypothetical protein
MLFKRAVFGQGADVLVRVEGKERLKGGFYKPEPFIEKNKGDRSESVPSNFMEMDEFSIISAVIYSGNDYLHSVSNCYSAKDSFLIAYHSNPKNPLPDSLFKFGVGIRKDNFSGAITRVLQSI